MNSAFKLLTKVTPMAPLFAAKRSYATAADKPKVGKLISFLTVILSSTNFKNGFIDY